MVFVCDVWTFILPTAHGWRSEDKFMVSVLSLHVYMGSGTELKLSGFAWTLLDIKSHLPDSLLLPLYFPVARRGTESSATCSLLWCDDLWHPQSHKASLLLVPTSKTMMQNFIIWPLSIFPYHVKRCLTHTTAHLVRKDQMLCFSFKDVETKYLWKKSIISYLSLFLFNSINHSN